MPAATTMLHSEIFVAIPYKTSENVADRHDDVVIKYFIFDRRTYIEMCRRGANVSQGETQCHHAITTRVTLIVLDEVGHQHIPRPPSVLHSATRAVCIV